MRRIIRELEEVGGSIPVERRTHHNWELDVNHVNIAYSSSHKDHYDEDRDIRRLRHPRDNLRDLKNEASEFE